MANPAALYTGLVLAARRPGILDPLARAAGVSHKCMVPVHGRPMVERVVSSLLESGCCKRVYVCIDQPEVLGTNPRLKAWLEQGVLKTVPATGNLADSVLAAAARIPPDHWPILISTGDNATHTPDIIRDFATQSQKAGADVSLGITREETVMATMPEAGKAFHRVKDGGFSSCNLYTLAGPGALKTVEVFRGGGQFGKRHRRILKSFGLYSYLLYKFKLVTIDGIARRIGRRFGLKVAPVILPYDYGPIDVDDQASFDMTEKILKRREG
jgi:GTP:adenosylcobinamide-phosphate guanylyltransferase